MSDGCTCTMIDPGNFYVEGGNAHPPEWEQNPWCPIHFDAKQARAEHIALANDVALAIELGLRWENDAASDDGMHPREARVLAADARELLALLVDRRITS